MDVKEEQVLGRVLSDHWYYRAKGLAMKRLLGDRHFRMALDVGAGSGIFSKQLLAGNVASAICVDPAYEEEERRESVDGKPIRFVRSVDEVEADVLLLMDVLEHVDDDVGLLRTSMKAAAKGAHVLITVPAFQGLFSAHDVFLDHKRRYSLRQLEDVVRAAGLEVLKSRYFFAILLPVAVTLRLLERHRKPRSNLRPHSSFANALLYRIQCLELPLLRFNRLAGLSVFCLARKP